MATTLISNGTVVTASETRVADVLIDGERIQAVAPRLTVAADRIIDAAGRYVFPGGIDVHTHLDMPYGDTVSSDDFRTGTIAAAHGGTTAIVDFAVQDRGGSLRGALDGWRRRADGRAVIDYGFHMIVCDFRDAVEREMDALIAEGVTSFKFFMAYPDRLMLDDGAIFRALRRTAHNGGLVTVHAENGAVIDVLVQRARAEGHTAPRYHALTRPARTEAEAVYRAIALAELAGVPIYIVHLSSAEGLQVVREARARGVTVLAETCPQYLFLDDTRYAAPGFEGAKYVMSPPLRARDGQAALWDGLARHDLHAVATDHCPFTLSQKAAGAGDFSKIPGGAPGIETRMSLMFDGGVRAGRLSLNRFVEVTATSPAKIFGLWPDRGTIAPGAIADVVVFDPELEVRLDATALHMRVDYSPYEGMVVRGGPVVVMARGEVVVEDGRFVGRPGRGRFIRRAARSG